MVTTEETRTVEARAAEDGALLCKACFTREYSLEAVDRHVATNSDVRKRDSISRSGVSLTSVSHPRCAKLLQGHRSVWCPLLNFSRELNFCREQLAQMLVKLTDRIGISTEKRKMAIDGLDRPELGIGN